MQGSEWTEQLAWVTRHTPLTQSALQRLPHHEDSELVLCFHLDLKMVPVIGSLAHKFRLRVLPCNPSTVDQASWQHLLENPRLDLWTPQQAEDQLARPPEGPRYLCDLGGRLICRALRHPGSVTAALEGTTSGLLAIGEELKTATPSFPIVDWNAHPLKTMVHNEKMVGFSLWQTFSEVTRLSLHNRTVGVLGFGAVGRGVARTARHLGGTVEVFDPDPGARLLARFEGFATPQRQQLLQDSEILVTATGRPEALCDSDLPLFRSGAFLLNAGHSQDEITAALRNHPGRRRVLHQVEELPLAADRSVFLLAGGDLVNLSAGFGDSINGFDLTSALLVEALGYLAQHGRELPVGLQALPHPVVEALWSDSPHAPR